jgi:hypothetical protein
MRTSVTRRGFLGAFSSLALATPALCAAELTPYDFGAKGDGSDDTAAFNRAVQEAAQRRRPLMIPRGDFVLVPPSESRWGLRSNPAVPMHVCVDLPSNLTVVGRGGRVMTRTPDGFSGGSGARFVLFGTGLNTRPGTLSNISFEDLEIDFAEQFGTINPFTYAFGLTGVDNFQQRNLVLRSTGRRAGRGLLFQNGRGRQQIGCRHENMVQGHYIHYEWNPTIRDISFERLTECMDWDGPSWGVDASALRFKNLLGEAQCIDTAGGTDWNIHDITAENTGSIIFIYTKPLMWPTYLEWLNNPADSMPTAYVIPERMTISRINARNAGKAGEETFRVANGRRRHYPEGISPPRDIVLRDVSVDGGYAANVNECRGLTIERMRLRGMQVPDDSGTGAALSLRQSLTNAQTTRNSELSGVVRDLTIENSAGIGLLVDAPSALTLSNVHVDGYNTRNSDRTRSGIDIRNLDVKNGAVVLDNLNARGGVGANLTDIGVSVRPGAPPSSRLNVQGALTGSTLGARSVSLP